LFTLLMFNRIQTGIGFLESSWYRIQSEFMFKICKTGLNPDSKKSRVGTPLLCLFLLIT